MPEDTVTALEQEPLVSDTQKVRKAIEEVKQILAEREAEHLELMREVIRSALKEREAKTRDLMYEIFHWLAGRFKR